MRKILLGILLLCSWNSHAWWDTGHKLVAQIAYDQLDAFHQAQLNFHLSILRKDYSEIKQVHDLAIWPDELRKQSINIYAHWHYIDTPYSSDGSPSSVVVETDNAIWALKEINQILVSSKAKPSERARFVAFLMHIVGDLHQPLHTISRSSQNLPEGDQGGNLFFVIDPNQIDSLISLHALWDSNFAIFKNNSSEDEVHAMAFAISGRYPVSYFGRDAIVANPDKWVEEGYDIAKNWVYQTPENEKPSLDYQKKSQEVIYQRIALAGYRLAEIIKTYG